MSNKIDNIPGLLEKREKMDPTDLELMIRDSAECNGYPQITEGGKVFFLYHGEGRDVGIIGDMTDWKDAIKMDKLDESNYFYKEIYLEPDARLQYLYVVDGEEFVLDSFNKRKVGNGLGLMSEIMMPEYSADTFFEHYSDARVPDFSDLVELTVDSDFLGYKHKVHVKLPCDYSGGTHNYPVLYFQDGLDYIKYAYASDYLSSLFDEKIIPECIVVFVTPPNLHTGDEPNRSTEYGMNDDYLSFFCEELVPSIDGKYRTIQDRNSRVVIGDSYGGLISTYIAFARSEVFGKVCSQSGYYSFSDDRLIGMFQDSLKKDIRLYLHVGTYEKKIGPDFIPDKEQDFLSANRRMRMVLENKGYDYLYAESREGHTWGNWRSHLRGALTYLLSETE